MGADWLCSDLQGFHPWIDGCLQGIILGPGLACRRHFLRDFVCELDRLWDWDPTYLLHIKKKPGKSCIRV